MTMKKAKYALEPKEDEESGGVGNVPDAAMKAGFKRARAVAEAIKAKYKDFATRCKQYGGNGCLTDVGNGYYWDPKHDTFAYFGNALVESKR